MKLKPVLGAVQLVFYGVGYIQREERTPTLGNDVVISAHESTRIEYLGLA
jgi:hypothetical protein